MTDLDQAIELLIELIRIPSFSREEEGTKTCLKAFFEKRGIPCTLVKNNLFAINRTYNPDLPTLLLNSHHDTVRPNKGYSRDPFQPFQSDGKLYGLGSNDAGGALVALILTFWSFYAKTNLPANLIMGISAEEEISGRDGVELLLKHMPHIDAGIVGEPTSGQVAVSEKGLMVLDCLVQGKAGHAARNEGENAIYKALQDIHWFRDFRFSRISETLGPIHMNVTIISAGKQHNVVPDECHFTVDVRTTDAYTMEETLEIIRKNVRADVQPRSVRLHPSGIDGEHVLRKAVDACGFTTYGSPTLSDQALMPFPTIKMGPGDSSRSHTADEFIFIDQIEQGIIDYKKLIQEYFNFISHETLG